MKKFWSFKNAADGVGELMLYGDISDVSWWEDDITPKLFKEDLDALGTVSNLNIYINSGGGDVFAGQAIHSMLKRHTAYKTVYIDGLAASIASVIAMAGDKIVMPKNATMMIHNAWTLCIGNKEELRKLADDMERIDASIVATYVEKTGLDEDEIKDLMTAETWFTAAEAVEKGFADELEDTMRAAASIDGDFLMYGEQRFDLRQYKNMPTVECLVEPQELPPVEEDAEVPGYGGESQPVEDIDLTAQKDTFNAIRHKILEVDDE